MAQGPQQPDQDGRRRDATPPAPFAFHALPPRARGDVAPNPNPVSWAIAELQDDLNLPATARATSPRSAFEGPSNPSGDRGPADAPPLAERRPVLNPPRSPSGAPTLAEPVGPGATEMPTAAADAPGPSPDLFARAEDAPTPRPNVVPEPYSASSLTSIPSPRSVPSRQHDPFPQAPTPPRIGRLLVTAVVALASGMIGAQIVVGIHGLPRPRGNAPRPVPVPVPSENRPQGPTKSEREAAALTVAIDGLKSRIGQLVEQIDGLGARVDRIETAKPEPPAELRELRDAVGRLSESSGGLAPLPGDVRRLDVRVANLNALLNTMRDELNALRQKAEKAAATAPTMTASPRTADDETPPVTEEARALAQGIKYFKQGRYREAIGIFKRLELTTPDDARVWYFAALSHGLATGQWSGDTERLIEKGIARERAGTPGLFTINAAVGDLTPPQGRDWLAEYRRRIPSKPADAPSSTPPANRSPSGRMPD